MRVRTPPDTPDDAVVDYALHLNDVRMASATGEVAVAGRERERERDRGDTGRVVRAEFTPTTPFCPQTRTLTVGSFRAWNGLDDRHEYDLVRVRAAPVHHRSREINGLLADIEETYLETGTVPDAPEDGPSAETTPNRPARTDASDRESPDAPF